MRFLQVLHAAAEGLRINVFQLLNWANGKPGCQFGMKSNICQTYAVLFDGLHGVGEPFGRPAKAATGCLSCF